MELTITRHGMAAEPTVGALVVDGAAKYGALEDAVRRRYLSDESTGLDRDSIEMREVTPMSGLLSSEERTKVLQEVN